MLRIPLSAQDFFSVFVAYNEAVWPATLVLPAVAAGVAVLGWRRPERAGRVVGWFLAALWIWCGVAYHLIRFAPINPAAYGFAGLFIGGAILFGHAAIRNKIALDVRHGRSRMLGV